MKSDSFLVHPSRQDIKDLCGKTPMIHYLLRHAQSQMQHATLRANISAADELVWECCILADLNLPQSSPTLLYEDNRACRLISENPVHSERSEHINFHVHALCERVAAG
jgi:hypothetical protein